MTFAETYRPANLGQVVGQQKLVGPNGLIRRMLDRNSMRSCIFYGPPGSGKTTVAKIIATQCGMPFISLNATDTSLADIRAKCERKGAASEPKILYLDEIQYFNKKQQQSLLPLIEDHNVTLIAATTDNPYYCCHDALISRCQILEFHPINPADLVVHLNRIVTEANAAGCPVNIDSAAIEYIAATSSGDARRASSLLDMAVLQSNGASTIAVEDVKDLEPSTKMSGFDTDGDDHYSLISGLQKSIRGSDPNAAVFYLARLLEGGDLLSPCRRLMVIAHEDIGLGNPDAISFTHACIEMAKQIGLPEANKPLTNAVVYLAISPKSSTAENTYNPAAEDVHNGFGNVVPKYLRHACSKGYLYPHDYPHHWVRQQYLPDDLAGRVYYTPGDNPTEQSMANYWGPIMR